MGQVHTDTATIAVMGATGSGKSTLINLVSGSSLSTSDSLRSCTETVAATEPFMVDGRKVVLVDTPGFDDTTKTDSEVLQLIANFLSTSYQDGNKLTGLLFIHRISDFRMGGISLKNFRTFRKLCGEQTLRNVIIVTNMWGEVNPQLGEQREHELAIQDDFFKPALDKGAKMMRHHNTLDSAHEIIRHLLRNNPMALEIQREIVEQHKEVSQTAAADEIERELKAELERQRVEAERVKREMEEAARAREEELRRQREEEARRRQEELDRIAAEQRRVQEQMERERREMEQRMREQEAERKREEERIRRENQERLERERRQAEEDRRRRNEEHERLQRELERQRRQHDSGGCSIQLTHQLHALFLPSPYPHPTAAQLPLVDEKEFKFLIMGKVNTETATIAVMGATGSGKTTFINLVSNSGLKTSGGLRSCTETVVAAEPFMLDGRKVVLVDTPGFDDTTKTDSQVLQLIADFLSTSYRGGHTLTGLLFFHRISDFRMGGISLKNFRTFRKLCGEQTLRNVIIVTNMWGEVNPELGQQREHELSTQNDFFKPALDKGAKMMRHQNTLDSAYEIIRHLPRNNPMALEIQREIVDQHKAVSQTAAAAEIERELRVELERQRAEAERVKREMEEAARAREEELRMQREEEARRRQEELDRIAAEQRRVQEQMERERQEIEQRVREQEEARLREEERIRRENQERLDTERRQAEEDQRRRNEELQRLQAELHRRRRRKRGGCSIQ